ncbi:molybdopterin-dependent oxidoreductase [Alcaligenaceae bacterium]|nr:molybdopterin-dependent oxidoreductase [Alcaligenaceae bacterium]
MTQYTAAHWGIYEVINDPSGNPSLKGLESDPNPSPIGLHMLAASRDEKVRISKPAVRAGWLQRYRAHGSPVALEEPITPARGSDTFVEVSWDEALDIVTSELQRVVQQHGNSSIFGGSYGWSSAGRFHHAQSQVHRFLNAAGGYVAHKDSYSLGAGRVIMPYIVATMDELIAQHTSWDQIIEHTELFISFGGVPEKSAQISPGGAGDHAVKPALEAAQKKGIELVNISPTRCSMDSGAEHMWLAIRPGTDTALMLALAYWLYNNNRHDQNFLDQYTVGFDTFSAYLTGQSDGIPKTPAWAAHITGIAQEDIISLAKKMANKRTMLNATWSLQRADYGEQPYWMLVTLACMLGQIGLPGGGFGLGYGSANTQGSSAPLFPGPTLSQGQNPVPDFIPVARIADMLLNPGGTFSYRGDQYNYPDIRLVYWAGGNPFHHHQDLNRLVHAWQQPDTIIVHESYWTSTARHADIVLPATTTFERDDIAYSKRERYMAYMSTLYAPLGESKDDYTIFSLLAEKMGIGTKFTEGRNSTEWLRTLYETSREQAAKVGVFLPDYSTFRTQGLIDLYAAGKQESVIMLEDFRRDPDQYPLKTASGRIEIFCSTIEHYNLSDCPGHATWFEPREWLSTEAQENGWLQLLSDQPKAKLHSQLDHSEHSKNHKQDSREPVHMHPDDAAIRGLQNGDLVQLSNSRGICLGSLVIDNNIRPGIIRQSTGAWFNPIPLPALPSLYAHPLEAHGNPNVLTRDEGTSSLSQGCSAYSCLVHVKRYQGEVPVVTAFNTPEFVVKN